MCRLMAVRALESFPLYRCLISGDNSFAVQSLEHPDGWGIAYYDGDQTELVKSVLPAICDEVFEKLSFSVRAQTVIGHIRKATAGRVQRKNCHPFRFGEWTFAHNGHIQEFEDVRDDLLALVSPEYRDGIDGDTDSELFFRLCLSRYAERASVFAAPDLHSMAVAVGDAIGLIRSISEPLARSRGNEDPCWLTCILSHGLNLLAVSAGKPLAMRVLGDPGAVRQVLLSSEEIATRGALGDGSSWIDIKDGHAVLIDAELHIEELPLSAEVVD